MHPRLFIIAWQFLTVIPLFRLEIRREDSGRSMSYFPLVGAVIGLILASSRLLLLLVFPETVTDMIVLVILIMITGGLHLDGFADTIDGLMGGKDKEETLRIMRDGRVGPLAVVGLVSLILLKYLSLSNMLPAMKWFALILIPVISRWSMVLMAFLSDYARKEEGLGRHFTEDVGMKELIVATIFALFFASIFLKVKGLFIVCVIGIFTFICSIYFRKKLGGVTGDVLGGLNELSELLVLLFILINI